MVSYQTYCLKYGLYWIHEFMEHHRKFTSNDETDDNVFN